MFPEYIINNKIQKIWKLTIQYVIKLNITLNSYIYTTNIIVYQYVV